MTASILAVEIRDELYAIIRDPVAALFSIAMPVGMFAVFATLFGTEGDGPVSGATLMLATFGAFGVISVALTPGIGIAEDRERGWLQVKRVSPVPVRTTLAAKVVASLPVAFGVYAAMSLTAFAMGLFDTDIGTWLQIAGLLLLGSLPFALLSMAVGFVARGRSAPAIINAVFLPMAIAGGLWMPLEVAPGVRAGSGRVASDLPHVPARTGAAGRRLDRRQYRRTARRHRRHGIACNDRVPFDAGVSRGLA